MIGGFYMKIALLSGVTSVHTHRWANALADLGHEVHLISLIGHKSEVNKISDKVTLHYINKSGRLAYFTGGADLKKLLAKIKPDILNAHYASGYGTLARRSGFHPTLLSVWGSDVYDFPSNALCRAILIKNLHYADALASTSHAMARQTEKFITPSSPIFVTPFGVDTNLFSPAETCQYGRNIGTVKTLEEKYGIEYLIRAFNIVCRSPEVKNISNIRLKIYGKGSLEANLKALSAELGLSEKIEFCGFIPNKNVPAALHSLDIACIPSILDSESFGVSAVEAMSCAVPVVVADVDGLKEVVDDKVTGFVVERKNPQAMADKIIELIKSPDLRISMGAAGRQRVLSLYNWDDNVRHMSDCLSKTVAEFKRLHNKSV